MSHYATNTSAVHSSPAVMHPLVDAAAGDIDHSNARLLDQSCGSDMPWLLAESNAPPRGEMKGVRGHPAGPVSVHYVLSRGSAGR